MSWFLQEGVTSQWFLLVGMHSSRTLNVMNAEQMHNITLRTTPTEEAATDPSRHFQYTHELQFAWCQGWHELTLAVACTSLASTSVDHCQAWWQSCASDSTILHVSLVRFLHVDSLVRFLHVSLLRRIDSEGWEAIVDMGLHYVCITWKLVLSVIPPAPWMGGYPCFFMAMFMLVGEW